MNNSEGLTLREIDAVEDTLNGKALPKVYRRIARLTHGGRREIKICGRAISEAVGFSERTVWDCITKLVALDLIGKRTRRATIDGVRKKITNAYTLKRPGGGIVGTVRTVVRKIAGGFLAYKRRALCEAGFTIIYPKKDLDSFRRSESSADALQGFFARLAASGRMLDRSIAPQPTATRSVTQRATVGWCKKNTHMDLP